MKKHKLLAVFLAIVLTLSLLPTAALAAVLSSETGAVASVTDQDNTTYYYYDDLKEAVNAAATGSTVKLLGDVDYSSAGTCLDVSKELTLDLNGHSIKAQANGSCANDKDTHFISVKNGGKLTVDDTSVGKNGSITAGYKYGSNLHIINVLSGAELTVKAGTIQNAGGAATNYGSSSVYVRGGGVFNLEGGTLHGETAKKRTYPVYNCGTTTISGGTITSNDSYANGITQSDGTLTITNVTVNTTAAAVSVNNKAPAPAISGGTFTKPLKAAWISDGFAAVYDGSVTTVGSSAPADYKACINGKVYYTAAADDAMKDVVSGDTLVLRDMPTASTSTTFSLGNTLTVTPENGETFDSSLITVSTGYKLTTSVSGASTTYTVAVDEKAAKAIIGDTYYLTFASANLGATDGNTIKLLKDDSLSGGWTVTKNITIDLNGHELTSEKKSSQSNHYATIKFSGAGKTLTITDSSAAKTGTILNTADASTTSKYGHALAASAGNVVIEGGTFTSQSMEAIYANGGAITVTGGTFSTNPSSFVTAPYGVTGAGPFTVACAHTGTLDAHAAVPADCTDTGTKAYWECTNCHKLFSDAQCETEIAAPEAVPAKGHTFGDWNVTKEPTTTEAGSKMRECSVCHFEETETIPVLGTYAITANVTNGTVTAAPNPAAKGQTVTLTLTPKDGYNDADVQLYYSYNDVVNAELSGLTFTMPDAAVTITGTFKPIEYQITYNLDGGTQSASNPNPIKYTVESDTITLSAPTRSGYTFLGWTYEGQTAPSKNVTIPTGSIGDKTFTAHWSYNGGGSSGGGGGSSSGGSSTSTTTEKNPDGSTTTTTTDKTTGTVTETTKNTDGSTTTVETKKDGTVTETKKAADGTTGTVITDKNGDVTEVKSTVSTQAATEAAKIGDAVTLPVEVPAAKNTEDAPAVQVTVPKSAGSVKVEIPVEKVTPGTVAVIVNADGTEKIVSTSVVTENGVALTLEGNATVKVIDNSKTFTDVPETNVFYNEISSLSAREIMVGKTEDTFDLHNDVTLNQVANVAGRITGAVDVKDFNAGIVWGNENGLKTGNEAATRGEVLKALYVAAGSPAVADTSIVARFNDANSIPADMAAIVAWAAQNGILKGTDAGNADLNVYVTRGQACALASRTMGTLA